MSAIAPTDARIADGTLDRGREMPREREAGRANEMEAGTDVTTEGAGIDETEKESARTAGVGAGVGAGRGSLGGEDTKHGNTDEKPRSDRPRTRSRSPARNGAHATTRTRSPPRKPTAKPPPPASVKPSQKVPASPPATDQMQVDPPTKVSAPPKPSKAAQEEDSDPEIAQMRAMMGFAGFKTTKNTKVPGNDVYAVRKEKKTEYRQYMNRVGGFNRPLSPSR
ncbi:hypothetical protein MMC19_000603 [Ptychographa xylographoides]|nr:hypothetical protein [Ptychographa xylographoides]